MIGQLKAFSKSSTVLISADDQLHFIDEGPLFFFRAQQLQFFFEFLSQLRNN